MDQDVSARLAMPLLRPGQAQKELFHNEALALIDIAAQASVVAVGLNAPPAAPGDGACWVIGPAPIDGWAGHADAIAGWTTGGWRFLAARSGMAVWNEADGVEARYLGGVWTVGDVTARRLVIGGDPVVGQRQPAIVDPVDGTTVDVPARSAVAAILAAMRAHGLITA